MKEGIFLVLLLLLGFCIGEIVTSAMKAPTHTVQTIPGPQGPANTNNAIVVRSNIDRLLATDSSGCKVFAIERSDCWVYVNNNGGIAVMPKNND